MNIENFVKDAVYSGAMKGGAREISADHYANAALHKYQRNEFNTPDKLIAEHIKSAIKESKGKKKK